LYNDISSKKGDPMRSRIISNEQNKSNHYLEFDHYIAFDWSQQNVALARLTKKGNSPKIIEWAQSDIKLIKEYLNKLQGSTLLTFEETTNSQWLYVEFKDIVDRIIVCDPYRNHLLSEGPKTDKIDSVKLCQLLKAGLLKEVYHSNDELYQYRCLLSAYTDLVKAGVRIQNQHSALYRARGLHHKKCDTNEAEHKISQHHLRQFVNNWQLQVIEHYHEDKKLFEDQLEKVVHSHKHINQLTQIPGIGIISAFKIFAIVIEPRRFRNRGCYLSYCGLVLHEKTSGGRSYGKRAPRFNRELKAIYITAARVATQNANNPLHDYFEKLIAKGLSSKQANLQLARYIARVSLAMMKSGQKYDPYRWRKDEVTAA